LVEKEKGGKEENKRGKKDTVERKGGGSKTKGEAGFTTPFQRVALKNNACPYRKRSWQKGGGRNEARKEKERERKMKKGTSEVGEGIKRGTRQERLVSEHLGGKREDCRLPHIIARKETCRRKSGTGGGRKKKKNPGCEGGRRR